MAAGVEVYATADLPNDIKLQALSFVRIVWADRFMGENLYRDWLNKEEDHPLSFVIAQHGLLVSFAQVVWRWFEHAGETFKVYGFSSVLTYPAFRGQGYGRQIVDAGSAFIRSQDADVVLFYCEPRYRAFYERSGWEHIAAGVTLMGEPDAPVAFDSEIMMMGFLSDKGKQARPKFERIPVFWTWHPW
ncbi:MAG: GNAT family N-acetyltransferase [Anaerolineae bacterium]|nr:GNAT family N-acetyltransferase [Anaerolineae bacterium]